MNESNTAFAFAPRISPGRHVSTSRAPFAVLLRAFGRILLLNHASLALVALALTTNSYAQVKQTSSSVPSRQSNGDAVRKQNDREFNASAPEPQISHLDVRLAEADRLRAKRRDLDANSTEARELKRLETLELLKAGLAGDESQRMRRERLVTELRQDPSIPISRRSEIAAYHDNLEVLRRSGLSKEERLDAFERVTRRLIDEFPEVPEGYESLLGIAYSRSDESALQVARELVEIAAAPEPVKREARILIRRQSLVGKRAIELAEPMLDLVEGFEQQSGRPVVLYTWTSANLEGVAWAKQVSEMAAFGVGLIGLNLDPDVEAAKAAAEEAELPGQQFFDAQAMAGTLTMNRPGLVFLIGGDGVLVSISAHRNLSNAIEEVAKL